MSSEAVAWAYRQATGSPGRKQVLLVLADKADEAHSCWPSQASIAEATEQGVRSVRRHLEDLENDGFIERTKRYKITGERDSDRYVLPVSVVARTHYRPERPAVTVAGSPPALPEFMPITGAAKVAGSKLALPAKVAGVVLSTKELTTTPLAPRKRGERLTEDWQPSPADIEWQRGEKITDADARRETEKFRDHFLSSATATARKLNWSLAWRNWIRRAVDERQRPRAGPRGLDPSEAAHQRRINS